MNDRGRYPGGQVRPAVSVTATQLQRLRTISRDPWLGSEIGRLLFLQIIPLAEAEAGWRVAEICARFDKAKGLHRAPASAAYEAGYGKSDTESEEDAKRAKRAERAYERLRADIAAIDPSGRAWKDLEALCIDDTVAEPLALPRVRQALQALAHEFGFATRRS